MWGSKHILELCCDQPNNCVISQSSLLPAVKERGFINEIIYHILFVLHVTELSRQRSISWLENGRTASGTWETGTTWSIESDADWIELIIP